MTFEQFIVDTISSKPPEFSISEWLMCRLSRMDPKIFEALKASALDPTKNSLNFSAACKWLKAQWPEGGLSMPSQHTEQERYERMGRMMNVMLAERRRNTAWLADVTGISYPFVRDFAVGRKLPREPKLVLIAQALGTDLASFMERAERLPPLP